MFSAHKAIGRRLKYFSLSLSHSRLLLINNNNNTILLFCMLRLTISLEWHILRSEKKKEKDYLK